MTDRTRLVRIGFAQAGGSRHYSRYGPGGEFAPSDTLGKEAVTIQASNEEIDFLGRLQKKARAQGCKTLIEFQVMEEAGG